MPWDLTGNSGTNPATDFLGTRDNQPLVIRTNGAEALRITGTGAVDVAGDLRSIGGFLRASNPNNQAAGVHLSWLNDVARIRVGGDGVGATRGLDIQTTADRSLMRIHHNGTVGIGTTNPAARLDVAGAVRSSGSEGGSLQALNPNNQEASVALSWHNDVARIRIAGNGVGATGGLDIQRTQDRSLMRIHNDGIIEVPGDIRLTGADCAENFDVEDAQSLEPGMVMVIGDEEKLSQCTEAYDKRVAGVISGAGDYKPGMILGNNQSQNKRLPVALTGKVYCKVDTQYAPIAVGDLLTTSPSPGHAMKASDPRKALGAVLGKALRPLEQGQGRVPILVALQ
jgi:hypothetical protein